MIPNFYGIPYSTISLKKQQANAIVERVHQTIGNIICSFKIQEIYVDNENPWEKILLSDMLTIRSMVHTSMQHTFCRGSYP